MADKNKKKKFSLKKLIYNDKYLIVFSIIAAVIVWVSRKTHGQQQRRQPDTGLIHKQIPPFIF